MPPRWNRERGAGEHRRARGGPDPGPNGFEVSAEGDLNGDGVTSLFTRVGVVDPQSGTVRVAPQIFVDRELE